MSGKVGFYCTNREAAFGKNIRNDLFLYLICFWCCFSCLDSDFFFLSLHQFYIQHWGISLSHLKIVLLYDSKLLLSFLDIKELSPVVDMVRDCFKCKDRVLKENQDW